MSHRTIRTIGATLVLVGLVVAGGMQLGNNVAGDAVEIEVVDRSSEGVQATGRPADEEPFVYRVGVLAGITTDNFWAYYGQQPSVWNSYILGPTKPALLSVDPATGTLEPELATSVPTPTWDAAGWRVRIDLDPSYRWSDGVPITADDFVFTYASVRALGLGGSWESAFPDEIESVRAEGDHRLLIEFAERPNLSVWPFGAGLAPVMAHHVWETDVEAASAGDLYAMSGERDVSGGQLDLTTATAQLIVSSANPGYPKRPAPDSVEYHVFDSEQEMIAGLSNGLIDTALAPNGLTTDQVAHVGADPGVSVVTSPGNAVRYLGFNLTRAPMSDHAFRSALALLVDRRALAEVASIGEPAWSFIPSANSQWFDPDAVGESSTRYDRDLGERLEEALSTLRDAGYHWQTEPALGPGSALIAGEGLTIDAVAPQPLTILTPGDEYDPSRPEYVEAIAGALAVLGFDARPVETDFDTVVDLAFTPGADGALHYDMYVLGWTLGNPALPTYYRPLFSSGGTMNNTGYQSAAFDAALEAYEGAFTLDRAKESLWEMERTLSTDLPYLLLYNSTLNEVYRADRVRFDETQGLGGLQARLGGIGDVRPAE